MKLRHKNYFTLAEVKSLLPLIRPKIRRIVHLLNDLKSKSFDYTRHEFFGGRDLKDDDQNPVELVEMVQLMKEIFLLGVQIKDMSTGLVDIPFVKETGEEMCICWKPDEEDIFWWHPPSAGFMERKPIYFG